MFLKYFVSPLWKFHMDLMRESFFKKKKKHKSNFLVNLHTVLVWDMFYSRLFCKIMSHHWVMSVKIQRPMCTQNERNVHVKSYSYDYQPLMMPFSGQNDINVSAFLQITSKCVPDGTLLYFVVVFCILHCVKCVCALAVFANAQHHYYIQNGLKNWLANNSGDCSCLMNFGFHFQSNSQFFSKCHDNNNNLSSCFDWHAGANCCCSCLWSVLVLWRVLCVIIVLWVAQYLLATGIVNTSMILFSLNCCLSCRRFLVGSSADNL